MPKTFVEKFVKPSSSDVSYNTCFDDVNEKSKSSGGLKVAWKLKLPLSGGSLTLPKVQRNQTKSAGVDKSAAAPPLPSRGDDYDDVTATYAQPRLNGDGNRSRERPRSLHESVFATDAITNNNTTRHSADMYAVIDQTRRRPTSDYSLREYPSPNADRNGRVHSPDCVVTPGGGESESIYSDAKSLSVCASGDDIMTSYTPPRECSTPTFPQSVERELMQPSGGTLTPQQWLQSIETDFLYMRQTSAAEVNGNVTRDFNLKSDSADDTNWSRCYEETQLRRQASTSDNSSLSSLPYDVTGTRMSSSSSRRATPLEDSIGSGKNSELIPENVVVSINSDTGDVRIYRRLPLPTSSLDRPPPKPSKPASLELFWAKSFN